MSRSAAVVLVLIAGITAMLWAGVMAYRIRKSLHRQPRTAIYTAQPDNAGANASAGAANESPAAQGLPDLRGKAAPAFTLKTVDGKTVSLADYKGKAVLINFWATWCGPCKVEMPWLIDLQKKYEAQGFTVLGISEDDGSPKDVADFASKIGVNYPILIASDAVSRAYGGIDYLPTSYYIGRDGNVVTEIGGLISKQEIESNIQKILTPPDASPAVAAGNGGKPNATVSGAGSAEDMPDLRGHTAPGFSLKTPDGKPLALADYKGKAVLLNFWGTWCAPCKLELPWLMELQKKYASQGFTVVGVAEDEDSAKDVQNFAARMHVDYPLAMSDDAINHAYRCCDYVPTSYYIGRNGKVMFEAGGLISETAMESNVQKILAGKGA